jgi:glucose/arabinose dehydrogenase
MRRRLARVFAVLFVLVMLAPARAGATPLPGFADEIVPGLNDDRLYQATALAFAPNGWLLVTTKSGRLWLYADGALRNTPALNLSSAVCTESERGLLGVAVDPAFNDNRFIYVYYTAKNPSNNGCGTRGTRTTDGVNRVARYTLGADGFATGATILIDNIPSPGANHNAGDLHFGKDGYLYVSVGDGGWDYDGGGEGGTNDAARDRFTLLGKILRITRDGGIPADNPFNGAGGARCYDPASGGNKTGMVASNLVCSETFAWGLRNPYRIAFDPNAAGTRFFINDVGQNNVEEISEGQAGADYGWNCREGTRDNSTTGKCNPTPPNMVGPVFEYSRPSGNGQLPALNSCYSITGGAFVPAGVWPSEYDGAYLFADFGCGRIFSLKPNGNGYTTELFVDRRNLSNPTHLTFGPYGNTQALYYLDYERADVRRVRYTGVANRSPVAAATATPTFGIEPLAVSFNASASSDPDSGDSIVAYIWNFGNGTTRETTGPLTSYTYTSPGDYNATLRVRDSRGAVSANEVSIRIDVGNSPPQPQILAPSAGSRFAIGEQITLSGSASDPEDGTLPASALTWEVRRYHAEHYHPYHDATGTTTSFIAPPPEDLPAAANSYLEIRLTATDSAGRSATVTRVVQPLSVELRFETEPEGLRVTVDGGTFGNTLQTPASVRSWPGYELKLDVPTGQSMDGVPMKACGWQHINAVAHTLITPSINGLYRAVFVPQSQACPANTVFVAINFPVIYGPR